MAVLKISPEAEVGGQRSELGGRKSEAGDQETAHAPTLPRSHAPSPAPRPSPLAPRLALAVLLFTLYLITSSGGAHIIDEMSLYAVSENLVRRGAWDTDQIAWSQWVNSPAEVLGTWGSDGHVYSKKGVAPALAFAPVRYLAGFLPGVGLLQATMLANALITIATALLLWAIARRLGYSEKVGAGLALIYGVATLAWPYATFLFGEPLSALCLTTALWALIRFRQEGGWRPLLVLGIALGVAIATSAVYAALLLVFGIYWLWLERRRGRRFPALSHWMALGAPLLATAIFLLWYNNLRFGSPLITGYHFESGEGFNGPLLAGLYGLLISPYRGILYHQPLTILSLIGFVPFYRRYRSEAILTGIVSVILVLAFAKWWIWWGGFAWGPRFLMPLAPYLAIWLLPLLVGARRWLVWLVAGLSALVQLLAVSVNFMLWEIQLRSLYPTDWNDPLRYGAPATDNPLHSPVFGQIQLLLQQPMDAVNDLAWWQPQRVYWWAPVMGLGLILLAGWLLFRWQKGRSISPAPWLLVVLLAPFTLFSLQAYDADERYEAKASNGYLAILETIEESSRPGDTIVTVAPYHWQVPMNRYNGDLPILGFSQEQPVRPETEGLLQEALAKGGTIYFVTAGFPPADPSNGIELWLNENAYLATDQWYDDFRLLRYGAIPPDQPLASGQIWGDPALLTLTDAAISTLSAQPGSILTLALDWKLLAGTSDMNLFVQLLPAGAPPVAQFDRNYPLSQWPANAIQTTPVALWLPPETPAGTYTLIAGWYDPDTGARLPVRDNGDYAILGAVEIMEP